MGQNQNQNASQAKGTTEKLITKSFDEIDEDDYVKTIQRLYENYESKLKGLQAYQKKSKTIRYLLSRGFEYEVILQLTEN